MNRNWLNNTTGTPIMNIIRTGLIGLCCAVFSLAYAAPDQHDEHEDEGSAIQLSTDAQNTAGIVVDQITVRALDETLSMPGEVVINAYQSSRVTPRITAQVVARHVRLGEHVESGQSLVTLSSVEMAQAQGALLVANQEWQRVKALGKQTVSERRYTEAQIAQQQSLAKVMAYGMTESQATSLMQSGNASKAIGSFDLLAPQSGTILQDDFIVGELIEPGRVLFNISDESIIWVEAQTGASGLAQIEDGAAARVSLDGVNWIAGEVIQRHHRLDETTRTQGLRIEIDNKNDRLHPGQFVEVEIVTSTGTPVLAVPKTAVTLIDDQATVFKREAGGVFHPEVIEVGSTVGDWIVVQAGLSAGEEIAIHGVFYLKSLLLKSSLGEGHGH